MAQFRLTSKLAKELNIRNMPEPQDTTNILDDWYMDLKDLDGNNIVLCIHMKSFVGVAFPLDLIHYHHDERVSEKMPSTFFAALGRFLVVLPHKVAPKVLKYKEGQGSLFTDAVFTKTSNKSIIRYASDLMYRIESFYYEDEYSLGEAIQNATCHWMGNLMKPQGYSNYTMPQDLLCELLQTVIHERSNVIHVDFKKDLK